MMDRLPIETDKQYLAYTCYRDLGLNRSMVAAQRLYDQKTGKKADDGGKKRSSGSFDGWARSNQWEGRVMAWDTAQEVKMQAMLLEANFEKYIADVEAMRQRLEDIGNRALEGVAISMNVVFMNLVRLHNQSVVSGKMLTNEELHLFLSLAKINRDNVAILSGARDTLYDAYGLWAIVRELEAGGQSKRITHNSP
jgi:hypothetical protein